jgi:AcrR family transcriptional regulator
VGQDQATHVGHRAARASARGGVGVRPPSLYKRVRDREALLGLVAEANVEELVHRLASAEPTIAGVARTYRKFARDRPEGFRLVLSSAADAESLARASAPVLRAAEELVGADEARSTRRGSSPLGPPGSSPWSSPAPSASTATSSARSTTASSG